MRAVEFVFHHDHGWAFSKYVPMENWERAEAEYKRAAEVLGLRVYALFNLETMPMNSEAVGK